MTLTKNQVLECMFSTDAKAADALLRRAWVFVWAPEGPSFVTSDYPFILMYPALGTGRYMSDVEFAVACRGGATVDPEDVSRGPRRGWRGAPPRVS